MTYACAGIMHWPAIFSIIQFPVIVVVFALLVLTAQQYMLEKFDGEYPYYRRRVPMFFAGQHQRRQFLYRPQLAPWLGSVKLVRKKAGKFYSRAG